MANCEYKVSTRRKLAVEKECTGISCSTLIKYRWSLYVRLYNSSHQLWTEIMNLDKIALTSLEGPKLAIGRVEDKSQNQTTLLGDKTYKIHLIAWLDKENFVADSYIFHTNLPPVKRANNSGCFVRPTRGEAIITEFSIECVNWEDSDWPLSYQYSYQTSLGVVVFHTGWQSNVTTELPVGNQTENYSLSLQLEVKDSFGDSSVEFIAVEVILLTP